MQAVEASGSFYDRIIVGSGLLGGVLIVLNGLFVTYEVLMRYLFNSPTMWVLEISIYVTLASAFLSFAYALRQGAHVKVDFITNYLSGRTLILLEIFTSLLAILFCLIMGWEGAKMALTAYQNWEVSPSVLRVPVFIPQIFIPLGTILLTLEFIRLLIHLFKELPAAQKPGEGSILLQFWITALFAAGLVASFILLKVSMNLGLLVLFFVTLFCGIPVAVALALFGVFGFYFLFGGSSMLVQIPLLAYSTLDSFVMVALPLFIMTSCVLRVGGVGVKIYGFANVLVRHLPGGLGIASIIFCGLFAAMTGSSVAVAAAVSMIALPEMLARGYSRNLTIGLLAAGGTLGILFPPSIPMMLYASMTNESLGALFMAGVIPGLILSGMFCIYVVFVAGRDKNIPREKRASFGEIITGTKEALGGLFTIVIIMGGIYSGIITPTESGGIAAIYSIILCLFIYRSLSGKSLRQVLLDGARISSFIMLIVIGANISGQVILMAQISQNILLWVKSMGLPAWVIILCINIFLIIMGGPLEAVSILVITLPILYPLMIGLGFSGVWFAIVMVINMELALISPPEGLNLFILQDMAKATAGEVSRGVIPFLIIIAIFLVLISAFPTLSTWLPSLMQ
jgi:C4-dicarboxylate transporter DctM subunit